MNTIVRMHFGSHLYGTASPNSDHDFKGVFMPSAEQVLLGRIPKSMSNNTKKDSSQKNSPDDVDTEMYSLHYFIHLACEGETVALDMLHAPNNMIQVGSHIWDLIVAERHRFYTKNLKAFVGYARRQASKYGIKGSRLNDAKRVLTFLEGLGDGYQLREVWDDLPEGEHIFRHSPDANGVRMYEVCGRKIGETTSSEYAGFIVRNFYSNYGARAKQAAANQGIDWKAVSHALRAAYQVKEILTEGKITFPLKEADYLRQVKQGQHHYLNEVAPRLEWLMDEVESLAAKSTLPESCDRKWWDRWLRGVTGAEMFKHLLNDQYKGFKITEIIPAFQENS